MQIALTQISSNSTVAHAVLHKFYLKQQIGVSWILLTTPTNLGKFIVAHLFSSYALGKNFENILSCFCFLHVFDTRKTTVVQIALTQISSNSTVAHAVLHKFYLKQQIGVSWILLTTPTNLGKFIVAHPFSSQALGQILRIFCQVVVFFTSFTQDAKF